MLVQYLAGGPILNDDGICQWFLNQETPLNTNILGAKLPSSARTFYGPFCAYLQTNYILVSKLDKKAQ